LALDCPQCGSPNIEQLAHYWHSLPAESTLRVRYAPPAKVPSQALIALLAVVAGIAITVSGSVLIGLLVAVGGLVFGAVNRAAVQRYELAMAEWSSAKLCLACTGRFLP